MAFTPTGRSSKSAKKEEVLQKALSRYVRAKYPAAVFTSEQSGLAAGYSVAATLKATRSHVTKHLDWQLAEPRGCFHGLYIELKKSKDALLKKDGTYRADNRKITKKIGGQTIVIGQEDHIQEQHKSIGERRSKGFAAFFSTSLDDAIAIVDWYMNLGEYDNTKKINIDNTSVFIFSLK